MHVKRIKLFLNLHDHLAQTKPKTKVLWPKEEGGMKTSHLNNKINDTSLSPFSVMRT
jgi:hypothetical protein